MQKTTGLELIKTGMAYLPLLDLSTDKLVDDYLNVRYGDFMTRFILRFALVSGTCIEKEEDLNAGIVGGMEKEMNEIATDIHNRINDTKNSVMGILILPATSYTL